MSMEIRQKHLKILKNTKKDGFSLIIFKLRGEESCHRGFQIEGRKENGSQNWDTVVFFFNIY